MKYISTEDSEKYDIKNGALTENPLRGSTARYISNPIVDDIEAPLDPREEYQPPSGLVVGDPSVNNLATHRWQNGGLPDAETEAALIQRIQDGVSTRPLKSDPRRDDERAFRQLLKAFHRTVVGPASGYIPGGAFYRRQPKNQKHTNDLLYEDLTSVGCFAIWQSAFKFDRARRYRFSTLSRHKIIGEISNEANYLRQGGYTSGDTVGRYFRKEVGRRTQGRLDRWIFSHRSSPPQELLEAQNKLRLKQPIFHSLEEAADALKRANNLEHSEVYSGGGDGDDIERGCESDTYSPATEPLEEWRDLYDSHNPLKWSPQLALHRDKVSPIVDFWINQFCYPSRAKSKRQAKPIYKPCLVKPTGRVLHLIDKPYWMEPRDELSKDIFAQLRKPPYDPVRREVAVIRFKNGTTKRVYRQIAASPCRHIKVNEGKRKQNVRPNRNQEISGPTAEIIILQSRASRLEGLHFGERYNPPCIGERFEGTRIAGER